MTNIIRPQTVISISVLSLSAFILYQSLKPLVTNVSAAAPCIVTLFGHQYDITTLQTTHSGGNVFTCGADMTATYTSRHGTDVTRMITYKIVVTPIPTAIPTQTITLSPTPTPTVTGTIPTPASIKHDDDENEDEDDQNEKEHSNRNNDKKEKESDHIQIKYKSNPSGESLKIKARIYPTAIPSLARPSPTKHQTAISTITPTPTLSGINQLSPEDKSFFSALFKFLSSLFG
jgi:hypothetical protein